MTVSTLSPSIAIHWSESRNRSSQEVYQGDRCEMISDRCTNTNGKVLVRCVGVNLLPTAQAWAFQAPGPSGRAPCAGTRHTDLFCHLISGQNLVTELQDHLWGRGVAMHGDTCRARLMAHGSPRSAQLGTDLA
jgi:hypothetical protein